MKSSSLMSIQSTVLRFVQILSRMLNFEVEVVDEKLVRIAGTGPYASDVGRPLATGTKAIQAVINTQKYKLIKNSGKEPECLVCSHRVSCNEKAFLGVPVMFKSECIGVISLVCFNELQREKLLKNIPLYLDYIENAAQMFIAKTMEQVYQKTVKSLKEVVRTVGDHVIEGVLELDDKGHCQYMNTAARACLKLENKHSRIQVSVRPFGKSRNGTSSQEKFIIMVGEEERILPGYMMVTGENKILILRAQEGLQQKGSNAAQSTLLIGDSLPMQRLKTQIGKIASSPSSVLIQGESGSGKEVVARMIHESGKRRNGPFVAINCAAIPEQLLESELFGYARGAFTGASAQGRDGLVKKADGGTLFLDEIGDMPLHLQAKLLRVLDRREVIPVGSSTVIHVDIRVISATHQDFSRLLKERQFREDLYYRLNVIPLFLPPLRHRGNDVELLIDFFLNKHAQALNIQTPTLDKAAHYYLNQWSWPGNVRELANVMEYLVNMVEPNGIITREILPDYLISNTDEYNNRMADSRINQSDEIMNLELMERQLITKALEQYGEISGKQRVADELGIGIATLYRKIRKYNLEPELST